MNRLIIADGAEIICFECQRPKPYRLLTPWDDKTHRYKTVQEAESAGWRFCSEGPQWYTHHFWVCPDCINKIYERKISFFKDMVICPINASSD